jgi:hypothetical protein
VEEVGEMSVGEGNFQFGKTFKYYFQCRRADIFGGSAASLLWESAGNGKSGEAAYSLTSLI